MFPALCFEIQFLPVGIFLFGDEPSIVSEQPKAAKIGTEDKACSPGGNVGGLHGDHVASFTQVFGEVKLYRSRPIFTFDNAAAIDEQNEFVVASGDGWYGPGGFF